MAKRPAEAAISPAERRKKLRENQDYFSDKISELTRYMGFGLVAASFSLLSRATDFSEKLSARSDNLLASAALLGCLVIACDFLQLLAGWWSNSISAGNEADDYRPTRWANAWRQVQFAMFYGKQILAGLGSIALTVAIASGISLPLLGLSAG